VVEDPDMTVTLADAQSQLPQLIERLRPGEAVEITSDNKPMARLTAAAPPRKPRKAGNCKGLLTIVADDDEHLKDFAEYLLPQLSSSQA
jgi:prevent-host-death family protein